MKLGPCRVLLLLGLVTVLGCKPSKAPPLPDGFGAPPGASGTGLAPGCQGPYLELNKLLEADRCRAPKGESIPFPKEKLTVDAKLRVTRFTPGEKARATIGINNLTKQPVIFDLSKACGAWFGAVLTDKAGTQVYGPCPSRRRCATNRARVSLTPGARAVYHIPLSMAAPVYDRQCNVTVGKPLPTGRYRLTLRGPSGRRGPWAEAKIEVLDEIPLPSVPAACRGARLDLNTLLAAGTCRYNTFDSFPWGRSKVTASIEPEAVTLAPGSARKISLVLRNPASKPAAFDLSGACDSFFGVRIHDGAGSLVDGGCRARRHCRTDRARLILAARGEARFDLTLGAGKRRYDSNCKVSARTPFAPGSYRVEVRGPLGDKGPRATARLTVR